jgi:hypothetical protein
MIELSFLFVFADYRFILWKSIYLYSIKNSRKTSNKEWLSKFSCSVLAMLVFFTLYNSCARSLSASPCFFLLHFCHNYRTAVRFFLNQYSNIHFSGIFISCHCWATSMTRHCNLNKLYNKILIKRTENSLLFHNIND